MKQRRWWLGFGSLILLVVLGVYSTCIEPTWVKVTTVRISSDLGLRIVQLSDLHYKGDDATHRWVMDRVNELSPDLICLTGDLVEDPALLDRCLDRLAALKAPLFCVMGNHDLWDESQRRRVAAHCKSTGGALLLPGQGQAWGKIYLCTEGAPASPLPRVALIHRPDADQHLGDGPFRLILAGHTHGGQVRIPGVGPLILPPGSGDYDLGRYETERGPLYVNAGIGTFLLKLRFHCRPEITVFEL
ncbi:MAG: metallophosphoesterase [Planctomycetota bacterium]|jgi:predicted MPP superfamily phosphohydrolase